MYDAKAARARRRNRKKAASLAKKSYQSVMDQWEDVYSESPGLANAAQAAAKAHAAIALKSASMAGGGEMAKPKRRGRANKAARFAEIADQEAYVMQK